MSILRMDHVGVVVKDLPAAIRFFLELGLELQGEAQVEGDWVGRVIGLSGVKSDIAMLGTPDGHSQVELSKFHSPAFEGAGGELPSNAPGLRHLTFAVTGLDDLIARLESLGYGLVGELEQYENIYRLCYVRGPEGLIVELAERIG